MGNGERALMRDDLNSIEGMQATLSRTASLMGECQAKGQYTAECFDSNGNLRWRDKFDNVVATVGKNLALDTYLSGAAYTTTGPFMGLISGASFTAVSSADTMASHGGWLEAGSNNAPTYTAPRKTMLWNAASGGAKAMAAALSFSITGTGTVKGAFTLYGTGASTTLENTSGTLYSAGLFSGGDRAVLSGDTINVSYTTSL